MTRRASSTLLFDLGRTCEKRPYTSSFGGVPPPTGASITCSRPGPRKGPNASTKPENTVNTVFFACFDTHLLSGHCRASTVSIVDTRGFGGVSRRPRYAPTSEHHEPFISPGPSGPGSGASLMLMMASLMLMTLAWRGGGPRGRNVVNTVFFACDAKNCSKTPRYVAAVSARSANRAHVAWVGAAPLFTWQAQALMLMMHARTHARTQRIIYMVSAVASCSFFSSAYFFLFFFLFLLTCLLLFFLLLSLLLLLLLLLLIFRTFPFLIVIILSFL